MRTHVPAIYEVLPGKMVGAKEKGGKIDKGVTSGEVSLSLSRGALNHTNKASTRSLLESRGWTFIVTPVRHCPRFLNAGPGPAVGVVMLNSRHFQLCVWTTCLQQPKAMP